MNDYEQMTGYKLPIRAHQPGSTITWMDYKDWVTYTFDGSTGKLLRSEAPKPVKPDLGCGSLAELQLEAIRGVVEELLTTSGSANPGTWGLWLLGEIGRILDMTEGLEVMGVLADQEEKRNGHQDD